MGVEKKKSQSNQQYSSTHNKTTKRLPSVMSQDLFQSDNMDLENQLCLQRKKSKFDAPGRSRQCLSGSSKPDETTKRHPLVLLHRLNIDPDTSVLVRDDKIYIEYPKHMNCSNEFRKLYINMCFNNKCIEKNRKLHFEYKHKSSTLEISNKNYCKESKDCGLKSKFLSTPITGTSNNGTFLFHSRHPKLYYKNKQSIYSSIKNNNKSRQGSSKISECIVIVEKIDKKIEFLNHFELKPKLKVELPDFNKTIPEKLHIIKKTLNLKVVLKRLQPFQMKGKRIQYFKKSR